MSLYKQSISENWTPIPPAEQDKRQPRDSRIPLYIPVPPMVDPGVKHRVKKREYNDQVDFDVTSTFHI